VSAQPVSSTGSAATPWRAWLRIARLCFTPLSLLLMTWLVWRSWAVIGTILHDADWSLLLPAALLWLLTNLLAALTATRMFKSIGLRMGFLACLRIHCRRLPAKYLPGGIWHSVGRASDYLVRGHDSRSIGVYFVIENVILVGVTLTLGASLVTRLVAPGMLQLLLTWLPVLSLLGLLGFPLAVQVLTRQQTRLHMTVYLSAILGMLGYWCLAGFSFALWIAAFPALELQVGSLETAGVYIFSWCMGYLALFAPQGIGVAEFVSGYLLAGKDATRLLGFLVSFRLLVLAADLAAWALSLLMRDDL